MFVKRVVISLCSCILIVCFSSCSLRDLREAETVVAQADSLWLNGRQYTDSTSLAKAYNTLHHSPSYAHACYHYGRLLRDHDDPVSAMQVFINASHSRTHDYHILGRVYSNMGSICHLANEFPLSYDMYSRSADMFLRNGDSINYYYALNDMAFEAAENRDFEKALYLLDSIKNSCKYHSVLSKINETRIILFKHTHQYDSILYYFDSVPSYINNEPLVLISKAQAFCYLHQYDSATHYAELTLQVSDNLYNLNNAYYILIHCDSINNAQKVYTLSADRADVQKLLEIRRSKMSQAAQLLEQDLNKKPNFWWLYSIMATLIVVGISISIYVHRKRKKQELLSQQIDILRQAASILQENHDEIIEQRLQQIQHNCEWFAQSKDIRDLLHKGNYNQVEEMINRHFFMLADKLKAIGQLNEKDVCLCILVMIGSFTDKQIADMLYYSYNSIRSTKRHVARKLGTTSANFRSFLIEKAVE